MRRGIIALISQKIKSFKIRIIKVISKYFRHKSPAVYRAEENLKIEESRTLPIDDTTVKYALEYLFSLGDAVGCDRGVGIIVNDVDDLRELNTFTDTVCLSFKYVTVYTNNIDSANVLGDFVYEKYGLPIMILSISEASRCRYPVIIDLVKGRVRYGRDFCIEGTEFKNGKVMGLRIGSRIVELSEFSENSKIKALPK